MDFEQTKRTLTEWREYPPNPDNEPRPTLWVMSTGVDRLTLFAVTADKAQSRRLHTYRTIRAANDAARRLSNSKKYRGWSRMALVRVDPERLAEMLAGGAA